MSINASSPASSGPAGSHFEAQVGAHYLLSLLIGAEPRGLPGTTIDRVEFQRAAEGHPLDDIIVHARDDRGQSATLEIQVKRSLSFAPSDQAFRRAVDQVANTSRCPEFFDSRYELAIAIARGSAKIEGAYQDVLTWARQLDSAKTFIARIERSGSANDAMRTFVSTFRTNLKQAGAPNDDETVWRLLSKLQILIFDFTAGRSASEALERERAVRALHPSETTRADALRSNLIQLAIEVASSAGERTRAQLIEDVSAWSFRLAGDRRYSIARNALDEAARNALADIVDRVGDATLMREDHIAAVRVALDEGRYVEIRGDAGVGKSGLLKHLAQQRSTESRIIVLSPGRTKPGGWMELRGALRFDGGAGDLLVDLAAGGGATLFIDGLDFFAEQERLTVVDLVREVAEVSSFTVIATARREFGIEEPNWLPEQALDKLGRAEPVTIGELDTTEIAELQDASPGLASLLADNHPARAVTRNLFRLAQLARQPDAVQGLRTETDMAERWWRTADGAVDDNHRDRARLLKALAEQALSLADTLDTSAHPSKAVDALVKSQTLRDLGGDRMSFRHDVFRDWAVANLLHSSPDAVAGLPLGRPAPGPLVRGVELAARMALERAGNDSRWRSFLEDVSREEAHGSWRRAALLALVRSEVGVVLLDRASGFLLANRATLLRELVRTVTAVDVRPASRTFAGIGIDAATIPENWNVPSEPWNRLIRWLLGLGESLPAAAIPDVATLYMRWSLRTLGLDTITPELLKWIHSWLTEIETARESEDFRERRKTLGGELPRGQVSALESNLRTGFLLWCHRTTALASEYLQSLRHRRHSVGAVHRVLELSGAMARAAPAELAKLTIAALIPDRNSAERRSRPEERRSRRELIDPPNSLSDISGLVGHEPGEAFDLSIDGKFTPPSPSRGPFLDLLTHAPGVGLRLIRHIVDHAISFHRTRHLRGSNELVISFANGERTFPWSRSYGWSRWWGNGDSCVTSALMALEAWAHRRIESGESLDNVLADVLGPPGSPSAYLLVAVDLLISHWPKSREVAIPFLACPELLCLDQHRLPADQFESTDVFGIESLLQEPMDTANLESLKGRVSRRCSLHNLLGKYAVAKSPELRETLAVLLHRAAERLGEYGERTNLMDPDFMVARALNLVDARNWKKAEITLPDGTRIKGWEYVAPPEETRHLASMRELHSHQLADHEIQAAIDRALEDSSRSSPELVTSAVEWARRHASSSDDDASDADRMREQRIVTAAMLAMRDGDADLRARNEAWARSVFAEALRSETDDGYRFRSGLRFNPVAVAFVGTVHLLANRVTSADVQTLLGAATRDDSAAAHGFGATSGALAAIDERLPRAVLRTAFTANVRPRKDWNQPEEQHASHLERRRQQVRAAMDAELSWLADERDEPPWPEFPARSPRIRRGLRLSPAGLFEDESRTHRAPHSDEYVDHRGAALWLRNASSLLDVSVRPWLRDVARIYAEWTVIANGSELSSSIKVEDRPLEWNGAYFDLLANCLPGMEPRDVDELALIPITSLPDEAFFDAVTSFLRSVDKVHFDDRGLQTQEAVRIRSLLADRLMTSSGWHWLGADQSLSIERHIGPAVAAFFLNDYDWFRPPRCYLPPAIVGLLNPFLPVLEQLVRSGPHFFVTLVGLNLIEVSPRRVHLEFIVTAAESWLANHPDNSEFWVEQGIGARLCALINAIRGEQSLFLEPESSLRGRIYGVLSILVGLGVAEAARLEQTLATDGDE